MTQVPEKDEYYFEFTGIERGVAAAFELSWEELTKSAQKLGCLLSLFALAPIPWSLVENICWARSRRIGRLPELN